MSELKSIQEEALKRTSDGQCHLLNDGFALFLQLLLAMSAMSTLLYKRYAMEPEPKRPYEIWLMDVGKQVIQGFFVHFSNIGLAILASNVYAVTGESRDECAFYFIGFTLDTFVGLIIIFWVLKITSIVALHYKITPLQEQGYYGEPPQFHWYLMQLGVFLMATSVEKFFVAVFMLSYSSLLDQIGTFLFMAIRPFPALELTIVMVVCPFFMSMIQFWIVDNFLMDSSQNVRSQESERQPIMSPYPSANANMGLGLGLGLGLGGFSGGGVDMDMEDGESEDIYSPTGRLLGLQEERMLPGGKGARSTLYLGAGSVTSTSIRSWALGEEVLAKPM